nr:immunoglobulin light chain junction region [Macaca mulatta]MOW15064.1 immunoglobulin light chain junction region [Macaca mulatta]MOW15159.1 immunoglobulin light chain junction region [Macaca mulatta]MOW15312.1 immunoglobulin light chain junction region [Macaca mulatta]MOW15321.1 immunoglobulin light chain junction region [Macaca mulatta]
DYYCYSGDDNNGFF